MDQRKGHPGPGPSSSPQVRFPQGSQSEPFFDLLQQPASSSSSASSSVPFSSVASPSPPLPSQTPSEQEKRSGTSLLHEVDFSTSAGAAPTSFTYTSAYGPGSGSGTGPGPSPSYEFHPRNGGGVDDRKEGTSTATSYVGVSELGDPGLRRQSPVPAQALPPEPADSVWASTISGSGPTFQPIRGQHHDTSAVVAAVAKLEASMQSLTEKMNRSMDTLLQRMENVERSAKGLQVALEGVGSEVSDQNAETERRLRAVENVLLEVQRSVQVLRDKQEIAEAQAELSKLQLAALPHPPAPLPLALPPPPPAPEVLPPAVPSAPVPDIPTQQLPSAPPPHSLPPHPDSSSSPSPSAPSAPSAPQMSIADSQALYALPPPSSSSSHPSSQLQQQAGSSYLPPQGHHFQRDSPTPPQHPATYPPHHPPSYPPPPPQGLPPTGYPPHSTFGPHRPPPPPPHPQQQQQQLPPQPPTQEPSQQYGPPQPAPQPHSDAPRLQGAPSQQHYPHPQQGPPQYPPTHPQNPQQSFDPQTGAYIGAGAYLQTPPVSAPSVYEALPPGHQAPPPQPHSQSHPHAGPMYMPPSGPLQPPPAAFRVAQPVSASPTSAVGPGGYPRLQMAQPVSSASGAGTPLSTSGGDGGGGRPGGPPPLSTNRVPMEKVVEDVAAMGFTREQVRGVVKRLTENGQSVDLNVVLDKLMNGGGATDGAPQKGWFAR